MQPREAVPHFPPSQPHPSVFSELGPRVHKCPTPSGSTFFLFQLIAWPLGLSSALFCFLPPWMQCFPIGQPPGLRHQSQCPGRASKYKVGWGRLGGGACRCSTDLSRRTLLVERSSLPGKSVTIALSHCHFEKLGYRGRNSYLWSLFLPHEDFSSSFGSELCNFYQGHRKQSKARGLWIGMSASVALQYETLPVVPEPPSAICQSQECPFLHLSTSILNTHTDNSQLPSLFCLPKLAGIGGRGNVLSYKIAISSVINW